VNDDVLRAVNGTKRFSISLLKPLGLAIIMAVLRNTKNGNYFFLLFYTTDLLCRLYSEGEITAPDHST